MSIDADAYLTTILNREAVDTSIFSPLWNVQATIQPLLNEWANRYLLEVRPSGSFSKGTANASGTDIDLFISLSDQTPETLKEVYEKLFARLKEQGYAPKRQNVSINIRVNGFDVDLVPAKRQNYLTSDHSLYVRRKDTWKKTNIDTHIAHVIAAGRQQETRIIKLWRNQKGIDFPSFYVELAVIKALQFEFLAPLSRRIVKCLEYFRDYLPTAQIVDPANTNNSISDDLTAAEKQAISKAAATSLQGSWENLVR
ncbi:(p)ppGpp synthase [Paraburkholderia caribensis]|uniref:nucleotidyltransferase domain-containing protein n=1 Tax=Paraburkholderia caribensis TaxID=75105 RepID=UPI001CAE6FF9|nr:nucleotidyltransferase [Paraburkholderia caribensis]CAG9211540.1 (p)ppGpp synthase [Paraburkholderia caribensis]